GTVTTGAPDTTAPTITARAPAVNATGVSRPVNVTVTFSEPVQGVVPAGLTTSTTFLLRNPAGQNLTAVVTQNGTTNQWTLVPSAPLLAGTRYTVAVAGG